MVSARRLAGLVLRCYGRRRLRPADYEWRVSDNADDQQIQQALDDDTHDAEHDRHYHEE